jgi:3-deoxy-D-manno-octulosonic acid kinase
MRRIERIGKSVILYDASRVSQISEASFDPASYPGAPEAPGYAGGRGSTLFISHGDQQWVLRHYHRGGLMGRWLDDEFPWLGLERSRPWREFLLFEELARL